MQLLIQLELIPLQSVIIVSVEELILFVEIKEW